MKNIKIIIILFILATNTFSKEIHIENNSDKLTLIYFEMTHCPYCRKMHKESFEDDVTAKYINDNFVYKNVNIEEDDVIIYKNNKYTAHKFARKINVYFYPSVLFLNKNNEVVYTVKGFRNYEKFLFILKYMKTNSYKTMKLEEFIIDYELNT